MKSVYDCTQPERGNVFEGFTGPPGLGGVVGPMGFIGPLGPDGFPCECEPPPVGACCVNDVCLISSEDQCVQWGGEYRGHNSTCEFAFCEVCEENVHCDCNCTEETNRCNLTTGECISEFTGEPSGCQICCGGDCVCPCDDGSCPPCPECPANHFQCQGECCPQGYCCVDCVGGDCDGDYGSGGPSPCPAVSPYCCGYNCSAVPCWTDCIDPNDCEDGECCCFGVCTSNCPCFEPPEPCGPENPCSGVDGGDRCCCFGYCSSNCPCDDPPVSCIGDASCNTNECCCSGVCITNCPCWVHPCEGFSCPPGWHREVDEQTGQCICVDDDIWDDCDNNDDCPSGYYCVNGKCVPSECACEYCSQTTADGEPNEDEPDYGLCCFNNCDSDCDGGCCSECTSDFCCYSGGEECTECCDNGGGQCDANCPGKCDQWLADHGFARSMPHPPGGNPFSETIRNSGQVGVSDQNSHEGYAIRNLPPGGDYDCGCTTQCPGGGCPDCLIGGYLGCCPAGEVCCGGNGCCLQGQCCAGNRCCDLGLGETCCGSECCGDDGPNAGICCGSNCCRFDDETPCCIGGNCVEVCPDGSCPNPSNPCGGGCGCDIEGDVCCGGNCCSESGPCCPFRANGCPCGTYTDSYGNELPKACCVGGYDGCCGAEQICCQGECAYPWAIECCADDPDGELCRSSGTGIERCCGVLPYEDLPVCCHKCGFDNYPICCKECCELYGSNPPLDTHEMCSYPEHLWGENPPCFECEVHGLYCNTCWKDKDSWHDPHTLVLKNGCECDCRNTHVAHLCEGTNNPALDDKYKCCEEGKDFCGCTCCDHGTFCTQAPEPNASDGIVEDGCCPDDTCECWKNNGLSWELDCCELETKKCCADHDDANSGTCEHRDMLFDFCNPGGCENDGVCLSPCLGEEGNGNGDVTCCEWYHRKPDGAGGWITLCCDGECYNTYYPDEPDYKPNAQCCSKWVEGHPDNDPEFQLCDEGCCPHFDVETGGKTCRPAVDDFSGCACHCSHLCGDVMGQIEDEGCSYYCPDGTSCCDEENCDGCRDDCPDPEDRWELMCGCIPECVAGDIDGCDYLLPPLDCTDHDGLPCGDWGHPYCDNARLMAMGYGYSSAFDLPPNYSVCIHALHCHDCYDACHNPADNYDNGGCDEDCVPDGACEIEQVCCNQGDGNYHCVGATELCWDSEHNSGYAQYAKYYGDGQSPPCDCINPGTGLNSHCCCLHSAFDPGGGGTIQHYYEAENSNCCGSGYCAAQTGINQTGENAGAWIQDKCITPFGEDCDIETCCDPDPSWCGTIYEGVSCPCADDQGCASQCIVEGESVGPCPPQEESPYWHGGCCPCVDTWGGEGQHCANCPNSSGPGECNYCEFPCESTALRSLPQGFDKLNINKNIGWNDMFEVGDTITPIFDSGGRLLRNEVAIRRKSFDEITSRATPASPRRRSGTQRSSGGPIVPDDPTLVPCGCGDAMPWIWHPQDSPTARPENCCSDDYGTSNCVPVGGDFPVPYPCICVTGWDREPTCAGFGGTPCGELQLCNNGECLDDAGIPIEGRICVVDTNCHQGAAICAHVCEGCRKLTTSSRVYGTGQSTYIPLAKPLPPVEADVLTKFQIVNFVADDGLKTDERVSVTNWTSETGLPVAELIDTKSLISKSEKRTSPEVGKAGFEGKEGKAQTIKGSLTTIVRSDGNIKVPVITFISGSNIRLATNEESNIIQISVDDLNLYELVNTDHKLNQAEQGQIIKMSISDTGLWSAYPMNFFGPTGSTFEGNSDLPTGILYNQTPVLGETGGVGATGELFYTGYYQPGWAGGGTTLGISSTVNFNSGFTSSGNVEGTGNVFDRPKFKDTAEGATAAYHTATPVNVILLDWDHGPLQYATGTAGGVTSQAAIHPIVNLPATGDAQTVTLIITDGGELAGSPLVFNGVWPGGTAPVLNSSGIDIISIMTIDHGVTNYCFLNGEKMT